MKRERTGLLLRAERLADMIDTLRRQDTTGQRLAEVVHAVQMVARSGGRYLNSRGVYSTCCDTNEREIHPPTAMLEAGNL